MNIKIEKLLFLPSCASLNLVSVVTQVIKMEACVTLLFKSI